MEDIAKLGGLERLPSDFETGFRTGLWRSRTSLGDNILPASPTKTWVSFFVDTNRDLMLRIFLLIGGNIFKPGGGGGEPGGEYEPDRSGWKSLFRFICPPRKQF
jgi:hypothetical protein